MKTEPAPSVTFEVRAGADGGPQLCVNAGDRTIPIDVTLEQAASLGVALIFGQRAVQPRPDLSGSRRDHPGGEPAGHRLATGPERTERLAGSPAHSARRSAACSPVHTSERRRLHQGARDPRRRRPAACRHGRFRGCNRRPLSSAPAPSRRPTATQTAPIFPGPPMHDGGPPRGSRRLAAARIRPHAPHSRLVATL